MARRDANLAGLAALGALGYALSKGDKKMAPVEDRVGTPVAPAITGDDQYNPDVRYAGSRDLGDEAGTRQNMETGEYYTTVASPKSADAPKSAAKTKPKASRQMDSRAGGVGMDKYVSRGGRYSPTDTGDEAGRLAARVPKSTRPLSYDERVAQIPTDAGKYAPVSGEKIDSSEAGRNASNIMNATAGLSVPGYVGKMTQAGYNARAAARRAAGDLTEAEIAAAKAAQQARREDKTLNPNAWLAGPKGMAENFKKGGAVKAKPAKAEKPAAKGWGKARGARGAKYY